MVSVSLLVSSLHMSLSAQGQTMVSALVFSTLLWLSLILALRFCLKLLLSYHRWMFEQHGRVSNFTKVWVVSQDPCAVSQRPLLVTWTNNIFLTWHRGGKGWLINIYFICLCSSDPRGVVIKSEASAVQLPNLPPSPACSCHQGHSEQGKGDLHTCFWLKMRRDVRLPHAPSSFLSTWCQCAPCWMIRSIKGCLNWPMTSGRTWGADCSGTWSSKPCGPPTMWVHVFSAGFHHNGKLMNQWIVQKRNKW